MAEKKFRLIKVRNLKFQESQKRQKEREKRSGKIIEQFTVVK